MTRIDPRLRKLLQFLFAFSCVFAGLALPSPGAGPIFTRTHAALGNALVRGASFERGVQLNFEVRDVDAATHPWQLTLRVSDPARVEPVWVPIDLRTLLFLPFAAFVALSLAVPLGSAKQNALLLGRGLLIFIPALWLLTALPLLSFLGGTGPVRAFRLAPLLHALFQTIYRAVVAPPGMMYALPLLLWWGLVARRELATATPAVAAAAP